MKTIILYIAFIIPLISFGQKDKFMWEFNQVNDWFFMQKEMIIQQNYFYYNQDLSSHAVDSMTCRIVRNGESIHYKFQNAELYSDSGFIVRIDHSTALILVSKMDISDSSKLKTMLDQGFSNFKDFKNTVFGNGLNRWELTGGVSGVRTAALTLDLINHQIKEIVLAMDENNPLVSVYGKSNAKGFKEIILRIVYSYSPKVEIADLLQLSDFILFEGELVMPSSEYSGYKILKP
jgi:hypothetical protein